MKYFTIKELTKSDTAKKHGISNTPNSQAKQNLENLVNFVLDPLREAYGKPIVVTSGYRCNKLNQLIGGSKTSQHCTGQAADICSSIGTKEENEKLFNLILELKLPFDQLINEHDFDWIHISYANRNMVLHLN